MIIAKLARAGGGSQFCQLDPGDHRLGSDFECEIVVIHPQIEAEHLTLRVGEGGVSFQPAQGAPVSLFRGAARQNIPFSTEAWTPLYLGDQLLIADIIVELEGVESASIARPGPVRKLTRRLPARIAAFAFLFAGSAVLANQLILREPQNSFGSSHQTVRSVLPAPSDEPPSSLDAEMIRRQLTSLGARIERLSCNDGTCSAALRVNDAANRDRVKAAIRESGIPFSVKIFADTEIVKAAELIATNLGIKADVLHNKNGVVTLSAIADEKHREKLISTLKSDVPGLAAVRFQAASKVDLEKMASRVTGVWAGRYPYVVTKDGAIFRPGDALDDHVKLVLITGKHLLVEIDGKRQKVAVR